MRPGTAQPTSEDPFPRMFIVCGIIALVLFAVVLGVLLFDFLQRERAVPPAPEELGLSSDDLASSLASPDPSRAHGIPLPIGV